MGWLWSSAAPAADAPVPTPQTAPTPTQQAPSQPANRAKAPTREELADQDLQAALAELNGTTNTAEARKPKYQRTPRSQSSDAESEPEVSVEESLLPTTMSCRDAFDSAFYCQSLGGQFNAVYRYGGMQSCSEHWASFWFCMRTKGTPEPERSGMVREHYRKRGEKYKTGQSSEDVWKGRDRKMEWGEAFAERTEEILPGESDEEWNKRERARRDGKTGTM